MLVGKNLEDLNVRGRPILVKDLIQDSLRQLEEAEERVMRVCCLLLTLYHLFQVFLIFML